MPVQKIPIEFELMEGFRLGRETSLVQLFKQLYRPLYYSAMGYTNNRFAADEIVADAFIRVWERRQQFFELPCLKSYLYFIVKNASLNWIKKNARHPSQVLSDNLIDKPEIDDFADLITAELLANLASALGKLSPQGKLVMQSLFFNNKTNLETAEEMGLAVSTVKTQKARALVKMRGVLGGWQSE